MKLAVVALVLAAWGVLPFVIFEGPYGEVPIPGSATVHLPAGELDPRRLAVLADALEENGCTSADLLGQIPKEKAVLMPL